MYRSPNIVSVIKSRRLRWVGHVEKMGKKGSSAFKILTTKPTGKRPLRRLRHRTILEWILKNIGVNTRNWIGLAQVREYWTALVKAGLAL